MSLFARLLQAVRSWRRRRGGLRTIRFAGAPEQLDHRQLLSVNFTGVVTNDFPATSPYVKVLTPNQSDPNFLFPRFGTDAQGQALQALVKVPGSAIQDLRVTYTAYDDTLSLGINQPESGNHPGQVIAGDADNNGNSGTVNPAVQALFLPSNPFEDPADFGLTENMGIFLNFNPGSPTNQAQVAIGFPINPPGVNTAKVPQVYQPASPANPQTTAGSTSLNQFLGNYFTVNDPNRPNLELSLKNFSQLYQQITGQTFNFNTSQIGIGGFGGTTASTTISNMFDPIQFTTVLPQPIDCPPVSPPILVNPHEHRIIDTLHRDLVRVHVVGTSGFKVSQINPATVRLSPSYNPLGAQPIAQFTRRFPHNQFKAATYVFNAKDLNLGAGRQQVTLTGQTFAGQTISTSSLVVNIKNSASVPGRLHRLMDKGSAYVGLQRLKHTNPGAINVDYTPATPSVKVAPTVRTNGVTIQGVDAGAANSVKVNYNAHVRAKSAQTGSRQTVSMKKAARANSAANVTPLTVNYSSSGSTHGSMSAAM